MQARASCTAEAPVRVLAFLVAANGRIDERELRALEELDAFRRIGVHREAFIALAREYLDQIGSHLCETSWLPATHRLHLDRLLQDVPDPARRLLVCRLAAAAITADGRVTRDELMVYEHTLASWRISHAMVSRAILSDRVH
jgi:hypothetical protein